MQCDMYLLDILAQTCERLTHDLAPRADHLAPGCGCVAALMSRCYGRGGMRVALPYIGLPSQRASKHTATRCAAWMDAAGRAATVV